jgi:hypothetical protein
VPDPTNPNAWADQDEQIIEDLEAQTSGARELSTKSTIPLLKPPAALLAKLRPPPAPTLPPFNGKTSGVLLTNEGQTVPFLSGDADPTYKNYPISSHAEGKAAIWIRQNRSTGGVVYHNNPQETCGYCNRQLETLLPNGSGLTVVPPVDAVAPDDSWVTIPTPYIGNKDVPRLPKQKGGDSENLQLWP